MRKNKFFDTIMIALVLMIGFRIMFPNALGGAGSSAESPASPYAVTLPHYDTVEDAMTYYLSLEGAYSNIDGSYKPDFNSTLICGPIFSSLETVRIHYDTNNSLNTASIAPEETGVINSQGSPVFYVGDTLWYMHAVCLSEFFYWRMSESNIGYVINFYVDAEDVPSCYAPFAAV